MLTTGSGSRAGLSAGKEQEPTSLRTSVPDAELLLGHIAW